MYNYSKIKEAAIVLVKETFEKAETSYPFHNWKHTQNVWNSALEIMEHSPDLSKREKEHLELAALFHDIGYVESRTEHELKSAAAAEVFLKNWDVSQHHIDDIKNIILATRLGVQPENELERIIQDADLSHLGKEDYYKSYKKLYKEIQLFQNQDIQMSDWKEMCLKFFDKHEFHTEYAKNNYAPVKLKNRQKIMELENELLDTGKKKKKKKDKLDIPEKGIETVFRVSLRNHVNLSRIADNKANTLISVNAIIISIVLSALFPKLDTNPYLIYPGIAFLASSIVTIIIAILSVVPKTTHGSITKEQVEQKKGNLLFFGNFHAMNLDDFEWSMDKLMQDRDYLYKSLTRDLFFLGKVLNRKYRYLRIAYYTFIGGLLISIILFTINLMRIA